MHEQSRKLREQPPAKTPVQSENFRDPADEIKPGQFYLKHPAPNRSSLPRILRSGEMPARHDETKNGVLVCHSFRCLPEIIRIALS